jgi:NitT/TauT family transport system substrate-binding protein
MNGRLLRVLSALASLALVGTACGDDEPAATAAPTAAPSTTAAGPALETTSLTAGALPLVDFAPLFYAAEKGYFAAEGLDVTIEVVQGGPVAAQLLLAGDIEVSFNNWLSMAAAVSNGAPLVAIANATHLGDGQGGVFVAEDSPIESLADLDGRTVATNTIGNVGDITVEALVADGGFDIEVQYVEVAFPEIIPAVQNGSVDAGFLTEPFTTFARQSGLRSVADPYTGSARNLPIAGYVATAEWAAANPNTVAAFRRAVEAATADLLGDEGELRSFIPQYSSVSEAAAQALVLPLYQTSLSVDDLQVPADLMFDLGFLDERLDMSNYVVGG